MQTTASSLIVESGGHLERVARLRAFTLDVPAMVREHNWATDSDPDPRKFLELGWGQPIYQEESRGLVEHKDKIGRFECYVRNDRGQTHIIIEASGSIWMQALRGSQEELIEAFETIIKVYPYFTPFRDEKQEVLVNFWMAGKAEPVLIRRNLQVGRWNEVERNYASLIRPDLGWLLKDFIPEGSGRFVLWHGLPGTGKTHAIRALLWEWRNWSRFNYITDPEAFFGNPAYMMSVILRQQPPTANTIRALIDAADDDDDEVGGEELPARKPTASVRTGGWQLLILEDCGELIASDAKERTGQGLSRLLNLVDGLIGQGLKVLVLLTTNEQLSRFHEAITRPGRAVQVLEFPFLEKDDLQEWLKAHQVAPEGVRSKESLAQLFARAAGSRVRTANARAALGFKD